MNKNMIWTILGIILVLISSNVMAETTRLTDTQIDYTPYKEVVIDDTGITYQIKIINLGTTERSYDILPDTEAIQAVGNYKLSPSDHISIEAGKQEELNLYLTIEEAPTSRVNIPIEIISGDSKATIELVARPIGPLQTKNNNNIILSTLKNILVTIIIILIIVSFISIIAKKIRKNKRKNEDDEDIETYY